MKFDKRSTAFYSDGQDLYNRKITKQTNDQKDYLLGRATNRNNRKTKLIKKKPDAQSAASKRTLFFFFAVEKLPTIA